MTRRISALLAFMLLVTLSAQAQIDRTKKPAAGPAPKAAFPEYHETTLDNGLKVLIVTNAAQPLVTFRLQIKSGGAFETKSGLSSFVTDLLTKGTAKRTSLQFATETDNIGISIGAGSDDDAMSVYGSGLKKYTEKILDLMTDAMYNPVFPDAEIEKLRKQTLSGLTSEKKDPDAISGRMQITVGFNDHPYSHFATEASVKSITRDDIVAFHKTHFIPNNSSLAIVGDVTPKDILPLIKKYFDVWKKGTVPVANFPKPKPITGRSVHLVDLGSTQSQTSLAVMTAGIPRNHPDYTTLSMANSILGGGFSGRLFQNLREKHSFTYGAYSNPDARRDAGVWMASSDVRRAATDSAAREIINEMLRMQGEAVPETELESHKQYAVGRYLLSLENPSTTAQRVQDIDLFGLPKDYYKTYAARVMAINATDIARVSRQYFNTDNIAITAVGDANAIRSSLEQFGPVFQYDTEMKPVKDAGPMELDIDVETLLRKHVEAVGGEAALRKISDRTVEQAVVMSAGPMQMNGTMVTIDKAPNKQYTKSTFMIDMGGGEQKFEQEEWVDGVNASGTNPMQGGITTYAGEELAQKLEDAQFNVVVRWKELGYTPTLKSKKMLDGAAVYEVEMKKKYGSVMMYFDAKTFMLVGEDRIASRAGQSATISMRYSDFRAVDGVMQPHKTSIDGGQMTMEAETVSIRHNTKVDDAVFKNR